MHSYNKPCPLKKKGRLIAYSRRLLGHGNNTNKVPQGKSSRFTQAGVLAPKLRNKFTPYGIFTFDHIMQYVVYYS